MNRYCYCNSVLAEHHLRIFNIPVFLLLFLLIGAGCNDSGEDGSEPLPGGSSSGIAKGDFNGDGFADLAVGVPDEITPSSEAGAGAVIVIYGSAAGLTATDTSVPPAQFWSQNTPGIPGDSEIGDGFGSALASGDFNDDGFSDLAIGIPLEDIFFEDTSFDDIGAVVVIYGSSKGLSATDSSVLPQQFDLLHSFGEVSPGDFDDENFGFSLAWGDFNGDEVGDLAIGIPKHDDIPLIGRDPIPNAGAVAVFFGSTGDGLTSSGSQFWHQDLGTIESDAEAEDHFGHALTSGDFNGDTVSDLAIGVPGEDFGTRIVNQGAVAIILGSEGTGLTEVGNQLLTANSGLAGIPPPPPGSFDQFGQVLTAGDFNRDLASDLVVGVPFKDVGGTDAGGVYAFIGRVGSALGGGVQFWNQNRIFVNRNPNDRLINEPGDRFGAALAAGDFDGDGHADLAIGAPFEVVTSFRFSPFRNIDRAGEVDVIYGSPDGFSITGRAPQSWHQDQINVEEDAEKLDNFGSSLTAWNFGNGPGTDLATGVPNEDVSGQRDAGAVNVLYGSRTGLTTDGDQLWTQDSPGIPGGPEAGDHFGEALY